MRTRVGSRPPVTMKICPIHRAAGSSLPPFSPRANTAPAREHVQRRARYVVAIFYQYNQQLEVALFYGISSQLRRGTSPSQAEENCLDR